MLHRRPRKCVSDATFEGKILKPKLKGRGLKMTDVVRRDIQRVWRQDCEDPGSEVRERWSIMLQPGNGAGYDQLTFLVPGLLTMRQRRDHSTYPQSFISCLYYSACLLVSVVNLLIESFPSHPSCLRVARWCEKLSGDRSELNPSTQDESILGASIYDVRDIFEFFDPPPLSLSQIS